MQFRGVCRRPQILVKSLGTEKIRFVAIPARSSRSIAFKSALTEDFLLPTGDFLLPIGAFLDLATVAMSAGPSCIHLQRGPHRQVPFFHHGHTFLDSSAKSSSATPAKHIVATACYVCFSELNASPFCRTMSMRSPMATTAGSLYATRNAANSGTNSDTFDTRWYSDKQVRIIR